MGEPWPDKPPAGSLRPEDRTILRRSAVPSLEDIDKVREMRRHGVADTFILLFAGTLLGIAVSLFYRHFWLIVCGS